MRSGQRRSSFPTDSRARHSHSELIQRWAVACCGIGVLACLPSCCITLLPPLAPTRPPVQTIPPSHCKVQDFPSGLRRRRVDVDLRSVTERGLPRILGVETELLRSLIHQHQGGVQLHPSIRAAGVRQTTRSSEHRNVMDERMKTHKVSR